MTERLSDIKFPLESCACSHCGTHFSEASIPEMAKAIATHWNRQHRTVLTEVYQQFDSEAYHEEHIEGDLYGVFKEAHYITAYDVIATRGVYPLSPEFTSDIQFRDVCVDCWEDISDVGEHTEVPDDAELSGEYLCAPCSEARQIEKRKQNNQQLSRFSTVE